MKRSEGKAMVETARSRTRPLKQMIQRRNELGEYIVAINLNENTEGKKFALFVCSFFSLLLLHSLRFASSSNHIPCIWISHFELRARIHIHTHAHFSISRRLFSSFQINWFAVESGVEARAATAQPPLLRNQVMHIKY